MAVGSGVVNYQRITGIDIWKLPINRKLIIILTSSKTQHFNYTNSKQMHNFNILKISVL